MEKFRLPEEPVQNNQQPQNPSNERLLFLNSLQLVVIARPLFGPEGQLVDALIEDANPAFCKATAMQIKAIQGQRASQLFTFGKNQQRLIKDFAEVAAGARSRRRESSFGSAGEQYAYEIFPLNEGLIAIAAVNITPQKEAIAALRENQQHLMRTQEQAILNAAQVEIQHLLIESRETERQTIATQLHEGLLQALIGIRYSIEEGLGIDQKEVRLAKLAAVHATLQREIQNLRDYCNELRPPTLAPFGLEKTIRGYIEAYQRKHREPEIFLNLAHDRQELPQGIRLVLFRAFQALFKSAVSRGGTRQVAVRFRMEPGLAELEIEDDSASSSTPLHWVELGRQGQLELASALERVEAVEGRVQAQAIPGKSTKVTVSIPIKSV